ncbi:MAG: MBL fold metallo-hydrolase [Verrucomicrobia bacterium]|jgi:L-ascorbate metabolism protein UlaG (beta-lactamase superfamily)|nr:MBL fold metallo-hydrolase [Verrucomicrobiota bacterium]
MSANLIKPILQDQELIADISSVEHDMDHFHVWWLGQSGFLVSWKRRHFLFDPYLSDSLTHKYGNTDKPHVRMTERVVAPEKLTFVDVVTSSHNHTDHLDKETLVPLMEFSPEVQMVIPEANRAFVANRLEVSADWLHGLDAGQFLKIPPFEIHAVPAAHENLDRDDYGRHVYLGYVIKFGPWTIYHSGDTVVYDGMEMLLHQWSIDLALLPINGSRPERCVSGNMWGREAAKLANAIGAGCVIPCHYEMFDFNTVSPDAFVETCESLGQTYKVLKAGERWTSPSASELSASNI